MAGYNSPMAQAALVAAGTQAGYVTVADNSKFIPGAEAWINHAGAITNVVITDVPSAGQVGLRIKAGQNSGSTAVGGPNYGRSDMSAFVAGDTLTQPAQFVPDATAPAASNVALLADITSAVNTLNDTGIIDASGFNYLSILVVTAGAEAAFTFYWVDESGTYQQAGAIATPPANTEKGWGVGASNGVANPLPRRVRMTAAAIAAVTTRIIVYGHK